MKKLIAGNWKMNGLSADAYNLSMGIINGLKQSPQLGSACDFLICPPSIHIGLVQAFFNGQDVPVELGAQDCSEVEFGARTGEISPAMLSDIECSSVILGHSERRQFHDETDELVASKAALAHKNGLVAIICVGESDAEREAGLQNSVVEKQLLASLPEGATSANTVIAYEPVWAIGTGKTATPEDVRQMHQFIREKLQEKLEDFAQVRILYGGSVKPSNAEELFRVPNVDGALIGGASLKADDYLGIASAALDIADAA